MTTKNDLSGNERQQMLEFLEAKMLKSIFEQAINGRLVLKGGLAMRLVYKSARSTQDIDLNADNTLSTEALIKSMKKAITSTLQELKTAGLILDGKFSIPKQTDTVCRWKINCTLRNKEPLSFKIEVSRRARIENSSVQELSKAVTYESLTVPSALIEVLSREYLVTSKIAALLADNRSKTRDLFDLFIMIEAGAAPGQELNKWATQAFPENSPEAIKEKTWRHVDALTFQQAKDEMLSVLDESVAKGFDEEMWTRMQMKVAENVSVWLIDALQPSLDTNNEIDTASSPGMMH